MWRRCCFRVVDVVVVVVVVVWLFVFFLCVFIFPLIYILSRYVCLALPYFFCLLSFYLSFRISVCSSVDLCMWTVFMTDSFCSFISLSFSPTIDLSCLLVVWHLVLSSLCPSPYLSSLTCLSTCLAVHLSRRSCVTILSVLCILFVSSLACYQWVWSEYPDHAGECSKGICFPRTQTVKAV